MLPQRPNFELFELTLELAKTPDFKPLWQKWEVELQKTTAESLIQPSIFKIYKDDRWIAKEGNVQMLTNPIMLMMSAWPVDLVVQGIKTIFKTHQVGPNPDLGQELHWMLNHEISLYQSKNEEIEPTEQVWKRMRDWVQTLRNTQQTLQKEDLGFWTFALVRAQTVHSKLKYARFFENNENEKMLHLFEKNIRDLYRCLLEQSISLDGLHRLYSGNLDSITKNTERSSGDRKILFYELKWLIEESRHFPSSQPALLAELTHPSIEQALQFLKDRVENTPEQMVWEEMVDTLKLQVTIPKTSKPTQPGNRL